MKLSFPSSAKYITRDNQFDKSVSASNGLFKTKNSPRESASRS